MKTAIFLVVALIAFASVPAFAGGASLPPQGKHRMIPHLPH